VAGEMNSEDNSFKVELKKIVYEQAEHLLCQFFREKNISEIEKLAQKISSNATELTLSSYLYVFPKNILLIVLTTSFQLLVLFSINNMWIQIPLLLITLLPYFLIFKIYFRLGGICKRTGVWKRGTILIKKNLPKNRIKSLAIHETFHSGTALGIFPELRKNSIIGEEAIATAIEVISEVESGNDAIRKNPLFQAGTKIAKSDIKMDNETSFDTIMQSIAKKAYSIRDNHKAPQNENLSEQVDFIIERTESLNKGLISYQKYVKNEITIQDYIDIVINSSEIELFGNKVGWAKIHGLLVPEYQKQLETILLNAEPNKKEMYSFLSGICAIQCGMWVGHLEKSGKVSKKINKFIDKLIESNLITPFQAYDLARRTVEGEYNEDNIIENLNKILKGRNE
jgi:hypothetical protein